MQIEYVKLISAVILLVATLFFTMLPLLILRRSNVNNDIPQTSTIISLFNCFGGGVFLATCLLHLFPDVQEELTTVFRTLNLPETYPASEFLLGFGFIVILMVEQIILDCREQPSDENIGIVNEPNNDVDIFVNNENAHLIRDLPRDVPAYGAVNNPQLDAPDGAINDSQPGLRNLANHGSSVLRNMMLVFALSLHSVFEGLAIGLQESNHRVFNILMAVLIHKSIIAFTLGLNLSQSAVQRTAISSNLFFSFASPIGVLVGLLVMDFVKGLALSVTSGILQGIAAGTFLYVTLFEVLPPELNSEGKRLGKLAALILGYGIVSILLYFLPG